jgi:hypothetical protein
MALKKELQENFQIANISELVSFDEEETNLSADGLEISFNTKNTRNILIHLLNPLFLLLL